VTPEQFHALYEHWWVDDPHAAISAAETVTVPGERVIVVGFPLDTGREVTLRLVSDVPSLGRDVVLLIDAREWGP
jgi:hypothetical protein